MRMPMSRIDRERSDSACTVFWKDARLDWMPSASCATSTMPAEDRRADSTLAVVVSLAVRVRAAADSMASVTDWLVAKTSFASCCWRSAVSAVSPSS